MNRVFLSGIAGTGMSALAGLFKESGAEVSGSDIRFYPPVGDILADMGITLHTGYAEGNIPPSVDLCVIGNVISRGNPEAEFILNQGIEYCSMAEALWRYFIRDKKSIVVAGTHGKTTIASFIAFLLDAAGLHPGFFIGGKPLDFPSNYRMAQGEYFVSEGDEYETAFFDRTAKFLKYHARVLLLTAIEHDHLDIYPTEEMYLKSFVNLVNQVPSQGLIIANADSPLSRRVVEKSLAPVRFFGEENAEYRIDGIATREEGCEFSIRFGRDKMHFFTPIAGHYNVWNLSAGIALGLELGISISTVRDAVARFRGVERRLQAIGSLGNTRFFEDFAHHPTAISSVIAALRDHHRDGRLTVIFEPRSWSLRRNFFQERLAHSFLAADEIVFKEVFEKENIREKDRLDLVILKQALEKDGKAVKTLPDYEAVKDWVKALDFNHSRLVLLLSNGDFGGLPNFIRGMCQGK